MTTRSCKVATADPFNSIVCMFQVLLSSHTQGEASQKSCNLHCKVGVYGGKLQVRALCLPAVQHDVYGHIIYMVHAVCIWPYKELRALRALVSSLGRGM
jgi:hypothetical protein